MITMAPLVRAISRFQRLNPFSRDYPGRCPGLLHFAPSALRSRLLTQPLKPGVNESRLLRQSPAPSELGFTRWAGRLHPAPLAHFQNYTGNLTGRVRYVITFGRGRDPA